MGGGEGGPVPINNPVVSEINFSDFPIVTYSLVGDYSDAELHEIANFLQEEFETIKNVPVIIENNIVKKSYHKLINDGDKILSIDNWNKYWIFSIMPLVMCAS